MRWFRLAPCAALALVFAAPACAGTGPRPSPISTTTSTSTSSAISHPPPPPSFAVFASDASADAFDAAPPTELPPPDAGSPLATLFDGDPTDGAVRLTESRCGPGCLTYPKGWLSADNGGFVYAWFFRGIGQYGTAEVMRSPLAKLDDAGIALRLRFAGGENVAWAAPVEGTVGKDHVKALIAEGVGTSRGRKARFWYAYVDLGRRKDLVIAYVVDGEPAVRTDETIAVVRSVRIADGKVADR